VDDHQVRTADRRLLERERQRLAVLRIADARGDFTVHCHALLRDHDERAWSG
jgi:hypothetical protein